MRFSYNNLQGYFAAPLPAVDKLAEVLSFKAFEVESIEKSGEDNILDIKILPNRAADAKSEEGMAREISLITGVFLKNEGLLRKGKFSPDVNREMVNSFLGSEITEQEFKDIVVRLEHYIGERKDLNIKEDWIEEVGRVYGYENIKGIVPKSLAPIIINKNYYYFSKIRSALADLGYSEIFTYAMVVAGEVELKNTFDKTRPFLRTEMSTNMLAKIELNKKNKELLGLGTISLFEIGKVFTKTEERWRLCLGSNNEALPVSDTWIKLAEQLGIKIGHIIGGDKKNTLEIDLTSLIESMPEPESYAGMLALENRQISYTPHSQYPFILRDVAVWVPSATKPEDVEKIIKSEGGEWLMRINLFDTFSKEDKTSYAFRLVFQSMERTLTDQDANAVHARIVKALGTSGFTVR